MQFSLLKLYSVYVTEEELQLLNASSEETQNPGATKYHKLSQR